MRKPLVCFQWPSSSFKNCMDWESIFFEEFLWILLHEKLFPGGVRQIIQYVIWNFSINFLWLCLHSANICSVESCGQNCLHKGNFVPNFGIKKYIYTKSYTLAGSVSSVDLCCLHTLRTYPAYCLNSSGSLKYSQSSTKWKLE